MNGLTSCHWLTIFTLLSNITGSCILIEGLSQSNNSVIVIDLDHYCGVCPTNGLCPYFTELVLTQFAGGLMMDDMNQFQEKGFLTHSLQLRNYILLLKMRKPFSTESGITTTGQNMSKLISGSKRGNFSSSEPTSPTSVSQFQEQTHREKTINASHLCVQRKLATSYICFDKMADYRVYQYDPNWKQFQGTGIKSSGKMRTAFLDVLTSLLYWTDSKGIKCACVDGGDVRTIILSRNVHDFTIDSKRGLIFYAYQHYGKSIIFCFNMNKKTKVLLLKAEGEIIMSINTEKQIMYWTKFHNKLLTLTYGREEKESTYKLLNYKRNKILPRLAKYNVYSLCRIFTIPKHTRVITSIYRTLSYCWNITVNN